MIPRAALLVSILQFALSSFGQVPGMPRYSVHTRQIAVRHLNVLVDSKM